MVPSIIQRPPPPPSPNAITSNNKTVMTTATIPRDNSQHLLLVKTVWPSLPSSLSLSSFFLNIHSNIQRKKERRKKRLSNVVFFFLPFFSCCCDPIWRLQRPRQFSFDWSTPIYKSKKKFPSFFFNMKTNKQTPTSISISFWLSFKKNNNSLARKSSNLSLFSLPPPSQYVLNKLVNSRRPDVIWCARVMHIQKH